MSEDTTPELGVLAVEALDLLTAAVRNVPAERWDDPSILQDWTVRELVAHATGSAWLGFGVGVALFGAAHRYQGWTGILATAGVGMLMTIVYLATGSLAAAMLLHALIDLNAVVVRPIVSGRLSSSAATPS